LEQAGKSNTWAAERRQDVELARAAASGDGHAMRRLADRLLDSIRVLLRGLVAGDSNLDDYVQESMIEILLAAGSYRGESKLETWANRIAIRTAMRYVKKQRWRARILSFTTEVDGRSDPVADAEVDRSEIRKRIEHALGALSLERRMVVTLRLMLGYSVAEVAEMMETSQVTVRNRLFLARKDLRRRMRKDPVLRDWMAEVLR